MLNLAGKMRSRIQAAVSLLCSTDTSRLTVVHHQYTRIAMTRFGAAFLLLTLLHCFAQGAFQASLYVGDARATGLLDRIVHTADLPASGISWLQTQGKGDYTLKFCTNLPIATRGQSTCTTVYETGVDDWSSAVVSAKNVDLVCHCSRLTHVAF